MSNNAQRILEAAEAVIVREGVTSLTLDATAAEAGVSKGGLLYHFKSKDKLVEGLVARSADLWRSIFRAAYEKTPEGPGRMARALLEHCLIAKDSWEGNLRAVTAAIFAATAQDPALIAPLRESYTELRSLLEEDDLPEGVSDAIWLAIDGLWLSWVLGLVAVERDRVERLHRTLTGLLERSVAEAQGGRA